MVPELFGAGVGAAYDAFRKNTLEANANPANGAGLRRALITIANIIILPGQLVAATANGVGSLINHVGVVVGIEVRPAIRPYIHRGAELALMTITSGAIFSGALPPIAAVGLGAWLSNRYVRPVVAKTVHGVGNSMRGLAPLNAADTTPEVDPPDDDVNVNPRDAVLTNPLYLPVEFPQPAYLNALSEKLWKVLDTDLKKSQLMEVTKYLNTIPRTKTALAANKGRARLSRADALAQSGYIEPQIMDAQVIEGVDFTVLIGGLTNSTLKVEDKIIMHRALDLAQDRVNKAQIERGRIAAAVAPPVAP